MFKVVRRVSFFVMVLAIFSFKDRTVFESMPVGVAELFTSEGCSSCPAAERTFEEMLQLTTQEGKDVIGLAFHVTYWDKLGWKDRFSKEAFTERQRQYVEAFGLQAAYTPQMVFNGEEEFVGSNPVAFRQAVEHAWSKPAKYELAATATAQGHEVTISYTLNKRAQKDILNIAWVEHEVESHILRGENKNLTLKHHNVVRTFKQQDLVDRGDVHISVPEDTDPSKGAVVLYIQNRNSLKVLGAVQVEL